MNQKEFFRLRRAINRYVKANVEDSWKGSKHPEDWPAIDRELLIARKRLNELLVRQLYSIPDIT